MLCPTPLGKASFLSEDGHDFITLPLRTEWLSYKKYPLTPSLSTGWIHILAFLPQNHAGAERKEEVIETEWMAIYNAFLLWAQCTRSRVANCWEQSWMPAGIQARGQVSLLNPVYNKNEKNAVTHYETLQKWRNCDLLLTLSVTELLEESKSDLHHKPKGHPKVTGRFHLIKGRVFSIVF